MCQCLVQSNQLNYNAGASLCFVVQAFGQSCLIYGVCLSIRPSLTVEQNSFNTHFIHRYFSHQTQTIKVLYWKHCSQLASLSFITVRHDEHCVQEEATIHSAVLNGIFSCDPISEPLQSICCFGNQIPCGSTGSINAITGQRKSICNTPVTSLQLQNIRMIYVTLCQAAISKRSLLADGSMHTAAGLVGFHRELKDYNSNFIKG